MRGPTGEPNSATHVHAIGAIDPLIPGGLRLKPVSRARNQKRFTPPLPVILNQDLIMTVNIVLLQPLIALIAGILILIMPRLLNFIVAIYLIFIGLAGLLPHFSR